jgi:hypothetical protein
VAEELVTEPATLAGTLDEAGDVGHHHLEAVVEPDHAEVGFQRRERVVGHLGLGRRDGADEGALAGVGEADQRDVGHELQLELQPALLPVLALLGEARGPAAVGQELGVPPAAPPAGRRHPPVALADEVGEDLSGVEVAHDGALGHTDLQVGATLAVEILALAVHTVAGPAVRMVPEGQQRGHVAVGDQPDVAPLAPIAPVRPAVDHRPLPPEADAAGATVASLDVQLAFVDEPRHGNRPGYRGCRRTLSDPLVMLPPMAELLFLPHYADVLQSVVRQALEQGVVDVECRDDLDPGVVAAQVRAFAARSGERVACKPLRGRVEVRASTGRRTHPAGQGTAQGA